MKSKALLYSITLTALVDGINAAGAADIVWTNTAGGDWSAAANWSPNAVPGATDAAWVTNNGTYTVKLSGSATIASLHLGGTSGTQTLSHTSGLLTLGGDSTGSANGAYTLDGGSLVGSGTLTLAGSFAWLGGTIGQAGSRLIVAANGGVAISTGSKLKELDVPLVNAGPGSWSGDTVSCDNNALFTNAPAGTFDFQTDGTPFGQGARAVLANAGTLRKSAGAGTTRIVLACYNSGLVQVQSGVLNLTGGGTNSGQFVCSGGGTVGFGGGTHLLQSASSAAGPGAVSVSAGILNIQGQLVIGSLTNTLGTVIFSSGGTPVVTNLTLNGGTLSGSDAVTVAGVFNWSTGSFGGDYEHPTSLTVTANGGVTMNSGSKNLNGGTLVNAGTGSWSGGRVACSDSALFTNAPAGTFDFQADGTPFFTQGGSPVLANAGTLRKSAGSGTTSIELPCYNNGLVQVQSGLLNLTGGGTNRGQFVCAGASTLGFGGGTHLLQGASSVTGPGAVNVSAGLLSIQGQLAVGSLTNSSGTVDFSSGATPVVTNLTLNGGTLSGSDAVTVVGVFNWTGGNFGGIDSLHPTSLTLTANGGVTMSSNPKTLYGGTLVNAGAGSYSGGGVACYNSPLFTNAPAGTFDFQWDDTTFYIQRGSPVLANAGTLRKSAGTGTTTLSLPCANSGSVVASTGTLRFAGGMLQTAGQTLLSGGNVWFSGSAMQLRGGTLAGAGTIIGSLSNSATVSPGTAPGLLSITGDYTESPSAVVQIELAGPLAGVGFTKLAVGGIATLAGTLNASLTNNYVPSVGTAFAFLDCRSRSGTFSQFNYPSNDLGMALNYQTTGATLQVTYRSAPALITNLVALPGPTQCRLSWQTSVPTLSRVEYGLTASYGSTTPLTSQYATNQVTTLSNLPPGTTFYYRIHVFDTLNHEVIAGGLSFTTLPDTTPPVAVLSNPPTNVCGLPLTFSWSGTDDVTPPAALLFAWRLDGQAWSSYSSQTNLAYSLLADGPHLFEVKAKDGAGNEEPTPARCSFTLDVNAPQISAISPAPGQNRCGIGWQTDKPATTQVEYGTNALYGQTTVFASQFSTNHLASLVSLAPNTTYHYRVKSQDGCGHLSASSDGQFTTQPAPDLQVAAVAAPADAWSGRGFEVNWVVTNTGLGVATGPWVDRVFLAPAGQPTMTNQVLGDFQYAGSLAPGQGLTRAQTVTIQRGGLTNGQYCLVVAANADGNVFESCATNNLGVSSNFDVYLTPLPDLVVQRVSAPATAQGGQTIDVSWTVCNQGPAATDVPLWYDHLYLSPATNKLAATVDYGQFANPAYLAPGDCYEQTAAIQLPAGVGGPHYLIVETDASDQVLEENETNNVGGTVYPINIQSVLPGFLHVESVAVSPAPPVIAWAGEPITITFVVRNTGQTTIPNSAWDHGISFCPAPGVDCGLSYAHLAPWSGPLAPGQGYTNQLTETVPNGLSGAYNVAIVVDPSFKAGGPGANIGRDIGAAPIQAAVPPPADLVLSGVSAPANAYAGQAINVQWTEVNNGLHKTSSNYWYDAVYLSTNAVFDPLSNLLLGTIGHWGALEIGAGFNQSEVVTLPLDAARTSSPKVTNYVFVVADAGNWVVDLTRTNNVAGTALVINATPPAPLPANLAVASVGAPGTVVAGREATVSWTVANIGRHPTSVSSWTDSIYLSAGTNLVIGSDMLVGSFPHGGSLGPGESYQQSQVLTVPRCAAGRFYLQVMADSAQQVYEAGAVANNVLAAASATRVLPSTAARLQVSALSAPATVAGGAPLVVSWTVANRGSAANNTAWIDALYLSTNAQFQLEGAHLLGLYPHSGPLAAGAAYVHTQTNAMPLCFVGPWFVYAVADVNSTVNWISCETNNWRRSDTAVLVTRGGYASLEAAPIAPPPAVSAGAAWVLQWAVTNTGTAATAATWSDAVYASASAALDTNALLLGRFDYTKGLPAGGGYVQNQPVAFPDCLSGEFYIFVVADADGRVNDTNCPLNNAVRSADPLVLNGGLYPDLLVSGVSFPQSGNAGQPLPVSWTVTNAGLNSATGPWTDSIYLSSNGTFDPRASQFLGAYPHSAPLAAGAAYTQTQTVPLPSGISGTFQVVVVTDSSNQVQECAGETNSWLLSPATLKIPVTIFPALQVAAVVAPASASSGQTVAVSWVVANHGTGPTAGASWNDALYLSQDQVLDSRFDTLLGAWGRPKGLGVGQTYTNSALVTIPPSASGPYYLIAVADSGGAFAQYGGETNNVGASPTPLLVTMPAEADLTATNVTVQPATGLPGDAVTIGWTVVNQSTNRATGPWTDAVYLSTNRAWDLSALQMARHDHAALAPGASYTDTWTGPLPGLTPGLYYALLRTDLRNNVREYDKHNNSAVSLGTISVDVPVLTLGQVRTNWLSTGTAQYYKVNVPAGETLQVTLSSTSPGSANELYLRYGAVADLGHYDFIYGAVLERNQQIVVPETQSGWYYLLVRGANVPDGPAACTIQAQTIPFGITSVVPATIGDNGQVTLTLHGARFQPGALVALSGPAVCEPNKITFLDSGTVKARFQFTNVLDGQYEVTLTNPDGNLAAATNPVTVEPALPLTARTVNGQINLEPRIGAPFRWNGYVANQGNMDIPFLTLAVALDPDSPITLTPPAEAFSLWTNATDLPLFIAKDVPPGAALQFSFVVDASASQPFVYSMLPDLESRPSFVSIAAAAAEQYREYLLASTNAAGLTGEMTSALGSAKAWGAFCGQLLAMVGLIETNDLALWPSDTASGKAKRAAHTRAKVDVEKCLTDAKNIYDQLVDKLLADQAHKSIDCASGGAASIVFKPGVGSAEVAIVCDMVAFAWYLGELVGYQQALNKVALWCIQQAAPPGCSVSVDGGVWGLGGTVVVNCPTDSACSGGVCPVTPRDPNELRGPLGYSAAAFVGVQQPWLYTVHFENVSNAAAYARQVLVTNKLDAGFDLRTFRLREIAFDGVTVAVPTNRCFYQTRIALPPPHATNVVADISAGVDVQNGQVFWTLSAMDLNTGALVESAQEGLLPPNDTNHVGEGHVVYTILPRAGVPTGAVITNQASIVFDINAPIDTNPTTNTVDAVPPTSSVAALPASVLETNFTVSWSGTDDPAGSGVRSYDVYVSDNGGPWAAWESNNTGNSDTFSGQPGHYYSFYSRAWDNAGNVESAPPAAEASILVSGNHAPTLAPLMDQSVNAGGTLIVTNVASDADVPSQTLAFSLVDAPAGMSIDPTSGLLSWVPTLGQAGTTNLVTVEVTDNGAPPQSASQSFLAVVGDYAELSLETGAALAGEQACVALDLASSTSLTNLSFVLTFPPDRLGSFSLTPRVPQIGAVQTTAPDTSHLLFTLQAAPGTALGTTPHFADLCFTPLTNQTSAAVTLLAGWTGALKPDGTAPASLFASSGTVFIVSGRPLLEAVQASHGGLEFTLCGRPGVTYAVETSADVHGPWTTATTVTLTGLSQVVSWSDLTKPALFIRLRQE